MCAKVTKLKLYDINTGTGENSFNACSRLLFYMLHSNTKVIVKQENYGLGQEILHGRKKKKHNRIFGGYNSDAACERYLHGSMF